jgi:putative nucleotidyltransferase with HDIG domain
LELLAMSGSVEITRQRIEAGKHFNLYAADDWAGFEFMYMLSGVLSLEDGRGGEISIQVGDYVYHNGLPEEAYFRVETDVELLLVCMPPSFHLIRDDMQDIMALARSVEEKDEQTEGHCSRLERLATLTGERLGLPGKQLIALSYGAYLHDIGKVMVPDEILGKTSALTDEEWIEIQRHPDHGAEMLTKKQYLAGAAEVVRAHHERFDGGGYPRGLRGEEIPIGARVVAVVDTYDAIVSARPYKKALAKDEAIQELEKNAGTQFDPLVVKAFLDVVSISKDEERSAP